MTDPASTRDLPTSVGEQPAGGLERLQHGDAGCYTVRTVTGSYLLDLTHRLLMRTPVTLTSGGRSVTLTFDVDGAWLRLVELAECAVVQPMRASVRIADATQPLRTSPVRAIEPLEPENVGQF